MTKKNHKNTTAVAHDAIALYLVHELLSMCHGRPKANAALIPLAEAMDSVLRQQAGEETLLRIRRSHFFDKMHFSLVDHGMCPFSAFRFLNSEL